ncbi:RNA-binding S4 domain-containing protein [Methylobacterium sp. J-059]|uniref:RNA-binding S4 domain-containing protein n=1 Tax=Methylobacterium sp. J-059 TaxID=2836643 RepID=UPI001FB9FA40|nr:RNA-binding S4 domain-containing protein [Methylobacterium sp. J-059]MCJ2038674.1 RNA-binding S4 domain-containing protein [Methylobacterium sp. J-059]
MKEGRQRLDKWLWFARVAKSRSLAARLVEDGHVRLNGTRTTLPAKGLAVGDVLTVAAAHTTIIVRVVDLGTRRGSAEVARRLYADLSAGGEAAQARSVSEPEPPLESV